MGRQVILYPDKDGYWVAECPSLPDCSSQGSTREEALANINKAIQIWIEDALAHSESIPDDRVEIHLVESVSSQSRGKPKFGSAKGLIHMADDFDAPLDDFAEYM